MRQSWWRSTVNLSQWRYGLATRSKQNAPLVWDDCAGNLCADGDVGDQPSTDAAFARAAHVERVTGVPMEPRSAIGDCDRATGLHTIHAGTGGGVVRERQILAMVLNVPGQQSRAMCGDMGGNFGTRARITPRAANQWRWDRHQVR